MTRKFSGVLLFVLLILGLTNIVSAEKHFSISEAYQIGGGTWYSSSGQTYNLVYTYANGNETTLNRDVGFTELTGSSEIYFDYKGVMGCLLITYYPDQDTYYAALYAKMDGKNWTLRDNTLYKKAYLK